jgi:hypothetical protein
LRESVGEPSVSKRIKAADAMSDAGFRVNAIFMSRSTL